MSLLTYIESKSIKPVTDTLLCNLIHLDDSIYIIDAGLKPMDCPVYMFFTVPIAYWNTVLRQNIYIENHPKLSVDPEYKQVNNTITLTDDIELACYISGIEHSHSVISVVECLPKDIIQKPDCPNQFIISMEKPIIPRLMLMIDNQDKNKITIDEYIKLIDLL